MHVDRTSGPAHADRVNSADEVDAPDLRGRLELLERAGVITHRARVAAEAGFAGIEAFAGVSLENEAGHLFVTHIAMTLTRLDRDEAAPQLPPVVTEEIALRDEEWVYARTLAEAWHREFGRPLPESEIAYLVVHLSVLRELARPDQ